jgi:adenine/guanine phosphoribosyltransferase-like PRPP-binding protein
MEQSVPRSIAFLLHAYSHQDVFEMQADSIQAGQNVIVIDDLIATGTDI